MPAAKFWGRYFLSTVIRRSALIFHSATRMFDLVNDVAAYPEFVDHCVASAVNDSSATHMRASLSLEKAGVALTFSTENRLERFDDDEQVCVIDMTLADGPFSSLSGRWQFTPLRADACKVSLYLEFVVNNAIASRLAANLFETMGNTLVDAFCRRADELYGPGM